MSSQDRKLQDPTLSAATVAVPLECFDKVIRTISLTVVDLDDVVQEIRLDGRVIGFIHAAGRIFVALTGTRMDWAVECGQSLLWDKAAATLVTTFGQLPQPEEPAPRSTVPAHPIGDPDRDTGRESPRRRFGVHAMSR